MRHYVTACRGDQVHVLFASMLRHCTPFTIHVLAWDFDAGAFDGRRRFLVRREQADIRFTTRADFLSRHPEFAPACLPGPPRRVVDQVATARWRFLEDVIRATGAPCTLIDGDQWFMSSPEPVFAEIGAAALAVSPHRIPPAAAGLPGVTLETHGKYGRYNAGFTHVADPDIARELAYLNWQWSYTEVVERPGRRPMFGDQAHLEDVAERAGAHVIGHGGCNVGPWNIHSARLAKAVYGDAVWFGGHEIVSYHFSSFRLAGLHWANACYEVERAPGAIELLYQPYARACSDADQAALAAGAAG